MADGISLVRSAVAKHVAVQVGLRPEQPTQSVANQRTTRAQSDIYAMPSDATNYYPLQVMDVTSSDFGKFYFLPDYSTPGGPDIVL